MYPAPFDYVTPASVEEAVAVLRELGPDAKVLAGGQSLIPLMKLRLATPPHLVDIGGIGELAGLSIGRDGDLCVGALVTEGDIERSALVRSGWPVLAEASELIADPLVRNRATVGGNLAHGDPANDHPAVMIALEAEVVIVSPGGRRVLPAGDFFRGLFETTLAHDELLTDIRVPEMPPQTGCAYVKRERQVGAFATAAAAAYLRVERDRVKEARVVLTNASSVPVRATSAEERLRGARPAAGLLEQAAEAAVGHVTPTNSVHGGADYRAQMFRLAVEEALERALSAARQGRHQ